MPDLSVEVVLPGPVSTFLRNNGIRRSSALGVGLIFSAHLFAYAGGVSLTISVVAFLFKTVISILS